jgi:hypothetical protein
MAVIENFSDISTKEQRDFAEALVKTINSERTFTDETDFAVRSIEADSTTGDLIIELDHDELISIVREATWTCGDEDEIHSDPGYEADYADSVYEDAKKAFKTIVTEIEGYTVELDIADVDEEETIEVDVDDYSHEDGGIGHYEFWGETGYDSDPYIEVEGTITKACSCSLALIVGVAPNTVEPDQEADVEQPE